MNFPVSGIRFPVLGLVLQQSSFDPLAKGEAGQRSICSDDAMTRDNHADRVRRVGPADGARAKRIPELPRELTIGSRFAEGNRTQSRPHALLKRRAAGRERKSEVVSVTGEIRVDLFSRHAGTRRIARESFGAETVAQVVEVAERRGKHGACFVDGDGERAEARRES